MVSAIAREGSRIMSALKRRIELIERGYDRPGIPGVVIATLPLPCAPTAELIEQWLADGVAHIAFRGHAVMYDGGERDLSVDEWVIVQAQNRTLPRRL